MARWLILALVMATGCGGGQRLLEVTGEVKFQGQPLADGSIRFVPIDGGPSAEAVVQDGKYKALVAPGKKMVFINGREKIGEKHPFGPDGPAVPEFKEMLPARYHREPTELNREISDKETRHDFDLTS